MGHDHDDAVQYSGPVKSFGQSDEVAQAFDVALNNLLIATRSLICDEHTAQIEAATRNQDLAYDVLKEISAIVTSGPPPVSINAKLLLEQVRHLKAIALDAAKAAATNGDRAAEALPPNPKCGARAEFRVAGKMTEHFGPCINDENHQPQNKTNHTDSRGNSWA